jgi:hypothetical protein
MSRKKLENWLTVFENKLIINIINSSSHIKFNKRIETDNFPLFFSSLLCSADPDPFSFPFLSHLSPPFSPPVNHNSEPSHPHLTIILTHISFHYFISYISQAPLFAPYLPFEQEVISFIFNSITLSLLLSHLLLSRWSISHFPSSSMGDAQHSSPIYTPPFLSHTTPPPKSVQGHVVP